MKKYSCSKQEAFNAYQIGVILGILRNKNLFSDEDVACVFRSASEHFSEEFPGETIAD